jgi:hypothetical protein
MWPMLLSINNDNCWRGFLLDVKIKIILFGCQEIQHCVTLSFYQTSAEKWRAERATAQKTVHQGLFSLLFI